MSATVGTRSALVEDLVLRYPEIPAEAVLKEDLLRTGIAFDEAALTENLDGEVKPKSYFIFSFDQKPLTELGEAARRRPPEELALTGGPYDLRRTIVSVRVNPDSPYRVDRDESGALALSLEGRVIADVGLPPMPEYYRHELANGKTLYLFARDTGTTSKCSGSCATFWPPFTTTGAARAGAGVTAALLGTSRRADGTMQVTYHGHPLYFFAKDTKAGQMNGEGVAAFGAKWYVLSPAGTRILPATSSGGYGHG